MLERDGRANIVYRDFKRVEPAKRYASDSRHWEPPKPPDGKTMGRALGKKGVEKIQERVVEIALPTRSSLVDDGVRVWIRR